MNPYGVATILYQRHDLIRHYSQAHNNYLQLLAEGGALLLIPVAAFGVCFLTAARRRLAAEGSRTVYWIRVGAMTGIGTIALQELVDFSLQIPANAFLVTILAALVLHPGGRLSSSS